MNFFVKIFDNIEYLLYLCIMKKLRKIQHHLQNTLDKTIKELLKDTEFTSDGIKGYIADVRRGYAYFDGQFTIPLWVHDKTGKEGYRTEDGYFTYYVAHELAHQLKYKKYGPISGHDNKFYEIFKLICPKKYQRFELYYKPSAKRYGIK